jgi:hypothetical protein
MYIYIYVYIYIYINNTRISQSTLLFFIVNYPTNYTQQGSWEVSPSTKKLPDCYEFLLPFSEEGVTEVNSEPDKSNLNVHLISSNSNLIFFSKVSKRVTKSKLYDKDLWGQKQLLLKANNVTSTFLRHVIIQSYAWLVMVPCRFRRYAQEHVNMQALKLKKMNL